MNPRLAMSLLLASCLLIAGAADALAQEGSEESNPKPAARRIQGDRVTVKLHSGARFSGVAKGRRAEVLV